MVRDKQRRDVGSGRGRSASEVADLVAEVAV